MSERGVILVRHGETALNKGGGRGESAERIRGWKDVPLDDNGKLQAQELGRSFKDRDIARIYSSPLSRAKVTAEAIEKSTGVPCATTRALMPWNLGDFTGKPVKDVIKELDGFVVSSAKTVPGGESFDTFRKRFLQFLSSMLVDAGKKPCVFVTHTRNVQCAKAWLAAGRPRTLEISTKAMNDYSDENDPGTELFVASTSRRP